MPFNDVTGKKGIIQMMEDKAGFNDGDISGNALRLAKWTARANLALDAALVIIFKSGGTWVFDDSNHPDYNILYADIVSGQRDYSFTTDGSGNLILEISKVFRMKAVTGIYEPIDPVSITSDDSVRASFYDELGVQGIPTQYAKMANGFLFDIIPNYNAPKGIKLFVSRESVYFATNDTTKMPGFAGLFHRYVAVHAVWDWGHLNLPIGKWQALDLEKKQLESDLEDFYGQREKDVVPKLSPRRLDPRTGKYRGELIY